MERPRTIALPPPIIALAGWCVPGSGYWLIGQRGRALTIGVTILILFLLGIFLGGIRVVEAPTVFGGSGPLVNRVAEKPWFIAQVLIGPIGLVAGWLSDVAAANPQLKTISAHGRIAEIATLYTAIAGMLNLMALIDAAYRASHRGNK